MRKRNAVLQFLFSPVMRRGLPGLFKCLMRLGYVKAAGVTQGKAGWDGWRAYVLVHMLASIFTDSWGISSQMDVQLIR